MKLSKAHERAIRTADPEKIKVVEQVLSQNPLSSRKFVMDTLTKRFGGGVQSQAITAVRLRDHNLKLGPGGKAVKNGSVVRHAHRISGTPRSRASLETLVKALRMAMRRRGLDQLTVELNGRTLVRKVVEREL